MKFIYFCLILLSYTHFGSATEMVNKTGTSKTEPPEIEAGCILGAPFSEASPYMTTLTTSIPTDWSEETSHQNKVILRAKSDAMTYIASNEEISSP